MISLPGGGRQERLAERDLGADVLLQQHAAVVLREQRAAVERIDQQAAAGAFADIRAAHQKMTREVDAVDVQARAPGDFHVDERQRDRNARAVIEHLVEAAVARILVALVAGKALFLEKIGVERAHARERRRIACLLDVAANGLRRRRPHAIELREIRLGDETRILDPRYDQRRMRERCPRSVGSGSQRVDEIFLHFIRRTGQFYTAPCFADPRRIVDRAPRS